VSDNPLFHNPKSAVHSLWISYRVCESIAVLCSFLVVSTLEVLSCLCNFFNSFSKEMRYMMINCMLVVNEIGMDIIFLMVECAKSMHIM
jgi:hypothetical protein